MQYPIPDVWQLVLAKVPVNGESLTDEYDLLYGPGKVLGLPIYYEEAVLFGGMTHGLGMLINGVGG